MGAVSTITRRTDKKGRVTLPKDFANCQVTLEREGDVLRVRKTKGVRARRYTFKQLMAGVTKDNIHPDISTGPPVGSEAL
jgi:hypothetical protein